MKDLKQHILEKLKVSKNSIYDITLESLIDALKEYKERKHVEYIVDIDLWEFLEEYPKVLHYTGAYNDKNINGNEILSIVFVQYNKLYTNYMKYGKYMKDGKDGIFIYLNDGTKDPVKIENTKELYDIFGDEVLTKIYDYLITH